MENRKIAARRQKLRARRNMPWDVKEHKVYISRVMKRKKVEMDPKLPTTTVIGERSKGEEEESK